MKVILMQLAKVSLIALEYDDLVFNLLSQEHKQELLSSRRRIVSRKIDFENPFNGQLIATEFQDHYIKSQYRIFKGSQIDCINFLDFYVNSGEFKPEKFVYRNKYGNVIKVNNLEDFYKIV